MKNNSRKKIRLELIVNGQEIDILVKAGRRLIDFLRDDLQLTGTKEGCSEGECGACTILLDGKSVLSCLIPLEKADGKTIVTIEGLSSTEKLHPLQETMIEEGGIQCGFCTPGMIMSGAYLFSKNPNPSREEIIIGISGNLCRCTGYQKIIQAVDKAAKRIEQNR